MLVFVVGIFDFSGAFTLKQKLTNIARDAARSAASGPAGDLQTALPVTVADAFQIIDNYMVANKMNDCNVTLFSFTAPIWTYSGGGNGCPPGGLTIVINRGYYFPATAGPPASNVNCSTPQPPGTQTTIIATCVSITYGYAWRFGRVASLVGGGSSVLPNTITATAVAMNED